MATPIITDVVNGKGYKADGVQFSLNPATGRYQEASTFQTPSTNTAMPSEVSPKMDFASFTKPQVQGSMASPYMPAADMSPVAQATAGTAGQIVKESQAQAQNTQAAQTEQAVADYVKKYLGLSGDTGVAEQKAAETAQLTQQAGISETTSKLKDLSTKMEALNIQTEAEKQAILASPIGGITSADLSGREQEITRKNNISRLNLAAESLVLQGKLDSAKDAIKNAIDLKYAPQEARYKSILEFNTLNEKILGKEAEKQKDLANAKIKDLEEKKKKENEISTMIATAVPNAPASVIASAKAVQAKGGTALEVATALGQYGGDYLTREKLKAEIAKMNADAAKTRADAKTTGGATGTGAASTNAKSWLSQYNSGAMSLEDIYTKIGSSKEALALKNEVANLVAAQGGKRVYGADDASIQAITAQIKNVDDLLTGGVGKIVGVVQGGGGIFLPDSLNVGKQDALAVAKNLVSNQTLQALADAKSKGVTFGALSEKEMSTVADAASRIAAKIKIDPETKEIIGFSGSESEFKKDLATIKTNLEKSIAGKTNTPETPEDKKADDIMTANSTVFKEQSKNNWLLP